MFTNWIKPIEKGIRIEYPHIFGLPLGNSDFVAIWLEFNLLVRTVVQSKWICDEPIYILYFELVECYSPNVLSL